MQIHVAGGFPERAILLVLPVRIPQRSLREAQKPLLGFARVLFGGFRGQIVGRNLTHLAYPTLLVEVAVELLSLLLLELAGLC